MCYQTFSLPQEHPGGSHVISTLESMRIHRLCLESLLSAVDADHISDVLVKNKTSSSVTLQGGVLLGTFEVLVLSSIKEPLPLPLDGVNAQNADMTDLTDVMAHLKLNVNVLDYPEAKPTLLNLLAQHKQAIALPGEPLGGDEQSHPSHYASARRSTFVCPFLSAAALP